MGKTSKLLTKELIIELRKHSNEHESNKTDETTNSFNTTPTFRLARAQSGEDVCINTKIINELNIHQRMLDRYRKRVSEYNNDCLAKLNDDEYNIALQKQNDDKEIVTLLENEIRKLIYSIATSAQPTILDEIDASKYKYSTSKGG